MPSMKIYRQVLICFSRDKLKSNSGLNLDAYRATKVIVFAYGNDHNTLT